MLMNNGDRLTVIEYVILYFLNITYEIINKKYVGRISIKSLNSFIIKIKEKY